MYKLYLPWSSASNKARKPCHKYLKYCLSCHWSLSGNCNMIVSVITHCQCALMTFGVHPFHPDRFPSPAFKSAVLVFFKSNPFLSSEVNLLAVSFHGEVSGDSIGKFSTIFCTISSTSLILGLDFGCRTRHLLAIAASFIADFTEQWPANFGSMIIWNFLGSVIYGLTHSKSFCSLFGRFLSIGLRPVISS